jgi:hypothetical protein
MEQFEVVVGAGTLRADDGNSTAVVAFPHAWTDAGVTVRANFTGAHLLHLAAAGCVLNDLYREAAALGLAIDGVRVRAYGDFNPDTWASTGIAYEVELDSGADVQALAQLVTRVDEVAEIPRALRAGASVRRV